MVQEYGQDWPEHTPEPVLALEFAALELLLQSDDLVVRSGMPVPRMSVGIYSCTFARVQLCRQGIS